VGGAIVGGDTVFHVCSDAVQELEKVMQREAGLRQKLQEAQEGLAERDAFLKQLQEEAALSASALKQAAQVSSTGASVTEWGFSSGSQ